MNGSPRDVARVAASLIVLATLATPVFAQDVAVKPLPAGRRIADPTARPAPSSIEASTTPFVLGQRHRFRSQRLHQFREVIVTTPPSYASGSRRYPVLYVLDGEANALIATSATRELASAGKIPEMIVVAVVNADRGLDFTPALRNTSELPRGISRAGGAAAFIAYLGDELVPYVDARFRTRPMRALVGHSLGGLVAMHALATRPELFRRYVTLDPSLWWDAQAEVGLVRAALGRHPQLVAKVAAVHSDSTEVAQMFNDAPPDVSALRVPLDGEAHEFLMYRGLYDGLTALYGDYYPAMRHDAAQASVTALRAQYTKLSRDFGYEVPIPLNSLLDVANREANQRRFVAARAALALADSLYAGAGSIAEFRAATDDYAAESSRAGKSEVKSRLAFTPVTVAEVAPLLGEWRARWHSTSASFQLTRGLLRFELHGDTLVAQTVADGVAFDGGTYRGRPAMVELKGDSLRWDQENAGGGRSVTTARLLPDGRVVGRIEYVDGHPLPVGFVLPEELVELLRVKRP